MRVSCCGQSSRMILLPILEGFEIVSRSLGCQRSCKDRRVAGAVAVEVFDASPSSFAILGEIDLDLVGVEGLNSSDARPLCRTKGGRRLPRSFVVSWPLLPRGEPRPSKTSAGPAAPLCVFGPRLPGPFTLQESSPKKRRRWFLRARRGLLPRRIAFHIEPAIFEERLPRDHPRRFAAILGCAAHPFDVEPCVASTHRSDDLHVLAIGLVVVKSCGGDGDVAVLMRAAGERLGCGFAPRPAPRLRHGLTIKVGCEGCGINRAAGHHQGQRRKHCVRDPSDAYDVDMDDGPRCVADHTR